MRTTVEIVGALALTLALGGCGGQTSETASASHDEPSPSSASPSPATSPSASPSPDPSPSPSLEPSQEPEPLGRSFAQLTVTGDIDDEADMRLAGLDPFIATWCDTPNDCGRAANSLQIVGDVTRHPGRYGAPRDGITVTIEVQDRFLFVSGDRYTKGECTVITTVGDERGFAGTIVCKDISNGTGWGTLTITVRGTFVGTY